MKMYLILGIIITGLGFGLVKSIQNSAKWELAAEQLADTVNLQSKEIAVKEQINVEAKKREEELQNETDKLYTDLGKLKRTKAQRDCDITNSPVGYPERMLKYAADAIPVFKSRKIETDTR